MRAPLLSCLPLAICLATAAFAAPPSPGTVANSPASRSVAKKPLPAVVTLDTKVEAGGTFAELLIQSNRPVAITADLYQLFADSPTAVSSAATLNFTGHRVQFFDLTPNTAFNVKLIATDLATNKTSVHWVPFITLRRRVTVRFPTWYCEDDSDDLSAGDLELYVALKSPSGDVLDSESLGSEDDPLVVPSGDIFTTDLQVRSTGVGDSLRVVCWVTDYDLDTNWQFAVIDREIDVDGGTFMTLGTSDLSKAETYTTHAWWQLLDVGVDMEVNVAITVDYVP